MEICVKFKFIEKTVTCLPGNLCIGNLCTWKYMYRKLVYMEIYVHVICVHGNLCTYNLQKQKFVYRKVVYIEICVQ